MGKQTPWPSAGWALVLGLSLVFFLTDPARAESLVESAVGDQMYFGEWATVDPDRTQGGSFTAHSLPPSTFPNFKTFCAEAEGDVIVDGGPSYAYRIIEIGLSNDGDDRNTISSHTAWLYTAFLNNTLPNYTADVRHEAAVQYGVWNSLGYSDSELAGMGDLNTQARSDYFAYGWDTTPGDWFGYGQIRIAQMQYLADGSPAQDILVYIIPAPEPTSLSLLALGGLTLFWHRQRRRIIQAPQA